MFVLLQFVALCGAIDLVPGNAVQVHSPERGYTVHIRDLTAPERSMWVPLASATSVLDAVGALKRQPDDLARMDLWLARPVKAGKPQVLRIDWDGLSNRGMSATNYLVLPGDRLFLQARPGK